MEVQEFADVFDALADTPAEAADLKARSNLLSALSDQVKAWGLPRPAAARRLGVTPARLDDALRGKLGRFPRDDLVSLTAAAEAA
jgi:predicted XRE-type DNA-binding protein